MALNIKHPEADRLARELAALTGESLTETVTRAIEERLARERRGRKAPEEAARAARIDEVLDAMRGAPVRDARHPDEILGYNAIGTFD